MSYATATAAIQPKTGQTLLDFVTGPFSYLNQLPTVRRAMQLMILKAMLAVYEQYPAQNQALITQIIAEIKTLTTQQLQAGRAV
jgi:hypothetical protein